MAQHQETKNEKNVDYYMDIFRKLGMFNDNKVQETNSPFLESPKNIWNWNAFFFGPLWMVHRGIDLWPVLLCLCLQLSFVRIISLNLDNVLLISACSIAILVLMTLFGYFGNRLYMIFAKYYISFGGLLLDRYRDAVFMGHQKNKHDWVDALRFTPYKRRPQDAEINEKNVRKFLKGNDSGTNIINEAIAVLACCFMFYMFYTIIIPKITHDAELYFWLFIFGVCIWFNIINAVCFFRTWRDWKNFRESREH